MLMEKLEKERDCSFEVLICHPLGVICFLIDVLNNGLSIEEGKKILKENRLSEESMKLLENKQLMALLERQYSQIKDLKTVITMLCVLMFHRIPRDIAAGLDKQSCA